VTFGVPPFTFLDFLFQTPINLVSNSILSISWVDFGHFDPLIYNIHDFAKSDGDDCTAHPSAQRLYETHHPHPTERTASGLPKQSYSMLMYKIERTKLYCV
jgi:hypothetical protein